MVDNEEGSEVVTLMMNGFVDVGCAVRIEEIHVMYWESGCGE